MYCWEKINLQVINESLVRVNKLNSQLMVLHFLINSLNLSLVGGKGCGTWKLWEVGENLEPA